MKRILLIRHGQTDWNLEERWQGSTDVPLNAQGIEQAHIVARTLSKQRITAVYSSDLIRAKLTADVIAAAHGLTVHADPRWRELHLGVFQGLTYHEISARYPEEVEKMRTDYMGYIMPQGESRRAMQIRTYEALLDIVAREPDGSTSVVVSHGGTIRVILLRLFAESAVEKRSLSNTSVTTIETDNDGQSWTLVKFADTSHLIAARDHESL